MQNRAMRNINKLMILASMTPKNLMPTATEKANELQNTPFSPAKSIYRNISQLDNYRKLQSLED